MASGEEGINTQKLSIRNSDMIDFGSVSRNSNFLEGETDMEAAAGDGERKKLKCVPIRNLQVAICEALSIF